VSWSTLTVQFNVVLQQSQLTLCFFRLKTIDEYVEKFLEEFNEKVQKLSDDDFEELVSCLCCK